MSKYHAKKTVADGMVFDSLKEARRFGVLKSLEKAGEISNSPFGYKLLIPLYGYSLLMMYENIDFMTILIFIAMVIGYIVYRRSFKLKTSDLVFTGCGAIAAILGTML